jgi:hypothetical protein
MFKLLIICVSIILLPPHISTAQTFQYGLKTGVNTSYFHGDRYSYISEDVLLNLDPLLGFRYTGGVITRINITPMFSLQSELLYTTKGTRFNENIEINEQVIRLKGNVTIGYVEVPLLFRFTTTLPDRDPLFYPKPGTTYNVYLGGAAGYRTRATFSGQLSADIFGAPFDQEFKDRVWKLFSDIDYSAVVGVGIEYGAYGETKYFIDIRYTQGFQNIANDPETNISLRNATATLSIGILF